MAEKRWANVARSIVGGFLVIESLAMLFLGGLTTIVGGLAGGLAFLAGAGNATEDQIRNTFLVMALSLASPYVVAAVLAAGGVFLLLGKRKGIIVAAGMLAIAAQVAFHRFVAPEFHAAELVPCAAHLLAIAIGIAFVPTRAANANAA